jgi:hypothetical protein
VAKCLVLGLVRCVFRYGVCNLVLRLVLCFSVNEMGTVRLCRHCACVLCALSAVYVLRALMQPGC